jgi:hypothetical protein
MADKLIADLNGATTLEILRTINAQTGLTETLDRWKAERPELFGEVMAVASECRSKFPSTKG